LNNDEPTLLIDQAPLSNAEVYADTLELLLCSKAEDAIQS